MSKTILEMTQKTNLETKLVFQSQAMQHVMALCGRIAKTDVTVLLQGETGTGKELAARIIHEESARKDKPFVKVDCGTLSETLLESELFGHEKGAFTGAVEAKKGKFELADSGTLFLDEITNMGVHAQARFLRVLQDKAFERVGGTKIISVDARLITATNKNLQEEVREGRFRDDLYYRLNVIPLTLPPLRERREDVPLLINYFLQRLNMKYGMRNSMSADALNALMNYDFPGNVRQLENLMERLVLTTDADEIIYSHVVPLLVAPNGEFSFEKNGWKNLSYKEAVRGFRKHYIITKLNEHGWNVTRAARAMGIRRQQVQRMMRQMGMRKLSEK